MSTTKDKTKLLFICLGNICRSPAAHAVMQQMVDNAGLTDQFIIASAGIGGWYVCQLPDKRMRQHGARRGYSVDHKDRQFTEAHDFSRFDRILVMDEENYSAITAKATTENDAAKVVRMADYFSRHDRPNVPDPYYGGAEDFVLALDLIEDGCEGLLRHFLHK